MELHAVGGVVGQAAPQHVHARLRLRGERMFNENTIHTSNAPDAENTFNTTNISDGGTTGETTNIVDTDTASSITDTKNTTNTVLLIHT